MDKTNIPTKKIVVGEDKQEIEIYEYLTQEEEDKRLEIMSGGKDINVTPGEPVTFVTNINAISESKLFLVDTLCKNINREDFNVMHPTKRKELSSYLEDLVNDEKKTESPQ